MRAKEYLLLGRSTLALLVPGILADHTNHVVATDHFAVLADLLD